jgi:hypothetical protein
MKGCLLIRTLFLGMALAPALTKGQSDYAQLAVYNAPVAGNAGENPIISNVPLNEINIHAFRHFRRLFPSVSGESWVKSADGYIVSFMENALRHQAHFDRRGAFLYSLNYYAGKDVPGDLGGSIKKKYPDYGIIVVTEITDGEKTFYFVKIENSSSVKTLSVCDGKMEVTEELVNGGR